MRGTIAGGNAWGKVSALAGGTGKDGNTVDDINSVVDADDV